MKKIHLCKKRKRAPQISVVAKLISMAALTKYPKLTGFDNRNAVSHSCEG